MRKIVYLLISVVVGSILLNACEKTRSYPNLPDTSSTIGGNNTTSAAFTAKVDGQLFTANNISASLSSLNALSIAAITGSQVFTLSITNPQVGTFTIDNTNPSNNFSYSPDNTIANNFYLPVIAATITITSYSESTKKVSGSFAFSVTNILGTDTKVITEGTFTNIGFTLPVTGGGTSSMSAQIDGTTFPIATVSALTIGGTVRVEGASGSMGSFPSVTLILPDNVTTGDHDLSGSYTLSYVASASESYSTMYAITPGKVTITEHNTSTKTIIGTFNGTASNLGAVINKVVTGSFTAHY